MNSYIIPEKDNKNLNFKIYSKKSASDLLNKRRASIIVSDKDYYSNINNMKCFINKNSPKFFENFELIEFLSYGSVGHVFKGKYKLNKSLVALKFIINKTKRQKSDKRNNKNEGSQEIKIWKKLHNSKITEIYAYLKINDYCKFSVLEYAKYGDLNYFMKYLLERSVLSETALNYFGKQILEGLEYIHRCKIAHMDIKPGNVLIDSDLNAKLTDFSVSCNYSSINPKAQIKFPIVGTSKFMAPEIISKELMEIRQAEKIDIYSFGVSLYYLFYGEYPYKLKDVKNKDYQGILKKIKEEELVFNENRKISGLFKHFLTKILEKDYKKRLNITQAIYHPWIQGSHIIFDHKENIYNLENFIVKLITDNIPKFNEYIRK